MVEENRPDFGAESFIVKESEAKSIHEENVKLLSGMDETEIMAERQQLIETMGEIFHFEFLFGSV